LVLFVLPEDTKTSLREVSLEVKRRHNEVNNALVSLPSFLLTFSATIKCASASATHKEWLFSWLGADLAFLTSFELVPLFFIRGDEDFLLLSGHGEDGQGWLPITAVGLFGSSLSKIPTTYLQDRFCLDSYSFA